MPRRINPILQDVFIQNYLACTGNIAEAMRRTITVKGKPLTRKTVLKWAKRRSFQERLRAARDQWRDDLFRVAMIEATGAPKRTEKKEDGSVAVLERHRPVPSILMFLLESLEPERFDRSYRLEMLRQQGNANLFTKFPLPQVTIETDPVPERITRENPEPLPPEYTTPPPKKKSAA